MRTVIGLGLVMGLGALGAMPAAAQTLMVGNKVEHTISFIDLDSGKEVTRQQTGRAPHEMAVSADGKTAVAVSYREKDYAGTTLHLFDVASGKPAGTIPLAGHEGLHGLKLIGKSDLLLVTSEVTKNVALVDLRAKTLVASIPTDQDISHMVAVAPDGKRAYVANIMSGTFSAIDLAARKKIADVKVAEQPEAIAVSPDGRELWVGSNAEKKVFVFDAKSLEKKAEMATDGVPIRIEFAPDGKRVVVSEPDRSVVTVIDPATRQAVKTVDLAASELAEPVTMLFAPDGKRLWVAATGSQAVAEIDTGNWTVTRQFKAGEGADGLAYSPLGVAKG